jgi:filamentous hemagglutinin family protein
MKNINKRKVLSLALCALTLFSQTVWALPQGGNVVAGSSTITQPNGATMHVNQSTDKSIINWQGYSIAAGEKVQYFQPGSNSVSLNRVVGADPSHVYGQLSANGKVWVVNPNGLLVGPSGKIETAGFMGSTLNIGNEDFMSGKYIFKAVSGQLSAISNLGNITAADGGYVVLISPSIANEGTITTGFGKTYLASGDAITLNFAGSGLIGFTIDKAVLESAAGITNLGKITADGGEVILSAKAAGDLLKIVVNNAGIIQARTIGEHNGVIKLLGDMTTGAVKVGGTLDASAPNGGDGGFIETSAAKVEFDNPAVTAAAPYGKGGQWLIDPTDITIDAAAATTYNNTLNTGTDVTVETASGGTDAGNITLAANIAKTAGTDATLTLKADNNIVVNSGVSISSTSNKLNVILNSDSDGSGLGNIQVLGSIATNGGSIVLGGGTCTVSGCDRAAAGSFGISLNSASLTSGGGDITLVGSATASRGILLSSSSINSGGGSLLLRGTTTAGLSNRGIFLFRSTVESGAGSLTLEGRGTSDAGIWLESTTVGNATQTGGITLAAQSNAGVDSIRAMNCSDPGCNAPKIQGAGTLTLKPLDDYTTIGLAGGAGDFNLSATELGYIQNGFPTIIVGGMKSGAITLGSSGWTVPTSANLYVHNANDLGITTHGIALNGALTLGTGKGLELVSDGAVTQTAAITVPARLYLGGAGSFTLDNAGNSVNTLAASTTGSISFTNGGALTVSGADAGSGMTLTADQINITDTLGGAGTLTLQPRTAATTIGLGDGAGTFSLDGSEIGRIDTGFSKVIIGRSDGTGWIEVGDMSPSYFKSDLTLRAPGAGGDIYVDYDLATGSGADAGSITLQAGRNITMNGGNLSSTATGNALVLSATNFSNTGGSGALSTPNGRWLVYSASPAATTKGGLTSGFRHYNASYASYAPGSVTETGNGFIYGSAAGSLSVNATSTAASHTYGATPSFGYTLSGVFADSEDNAASIGVSGTPVYSVTSATPAGSYTVNYVSGLTSTAGYGFTAGTGLAYTVNAAPVAITSPAERSFKNTLNTVENIQKVITASGSINLNDIGGGVQIVGFDKFFAPKAVEYRIETENR